MLRMRPGPNLFFLTCNAAQNSLFQICCHYFVSPLFLSKGIVQVDDTGIYLLTGNSKANFQCYSHLATIECHTDFGKESWQVKDHLLSNPAVSDIYALMCTSLE